MILQGKYLFSPKDEFNELELSNFASVVDAFERRIQGWFLNPIRQLLENDSNLFVITATECMIVDALSGFFYGLERDTMKADFIGFLSKEAGIQRIVAKEFYDRFRCGIIHQTSIKKRSSISKEVEDIYLQDDGILFFNPEGFYRKLGDYSKVYIGRLRSDKETQKNFKKRFKYLFNEEFSRDKWKHW